MEPSCDLLVRQPLGDQPKDLQLARRQLDVLRALVGPEHRRERRQAGEQARGDLRGDPCLAPRGQADHLPELIDRGVLAHIAGGAGFDHLGHRLGELLDAEHDDPDAVEATGDRARELDRPRPERRQEDQVGSPLLDPI